MNNHGLFLVHGFIVTQLIGLTTGLFALRMTMTIDHNLNLINVKLLELWMGLNHLEDTTIIDFDDGVGALA